MFVCEEYISMADKNKNSFISVMPKSKFEKKNSYRLIFATTVQETFAGENKKKR